MSHIAIWKYYDETTKYYFNEDSTGTLQPTYVDRIKLLVVPEIPVMNKKVENVNGLLQYSSGSFKIRVSLLQTETSANGDTIKDFLFPTDKPNKFLCQVYFNDNCHFAGFFTTADLNKALTFMKGDYFIDIQVTGCLKEFADSYSQSNQGTRVPGGNGTMTFELYMSYHFDSHTRWILDLPSTTYDARVGETIRFNNRVQYAVSINGAYFNNIPRWETFKQLALSMGFNYKLEFTQGSQWITQTPQFTLKIFWIQDIASETAVSLSVKSHDVSYMQNAEWLFIPSRYANVDYPPFGVKKTYQGILISPNTSLSISFNELDFSPDIPNITAFLYPDVDTADGFLVKNTLMFRDPTGQTTYESPTYVNLDNLQIVEQVFYEYTAYIINFMFNPGGMTYGFFFGTTATHRHSPVQNYLVDTYARYMLGLKEVKEMDVVFDGTQEIDLYKRVTLEDKDFYISEINDINLTTRTAKIKAVEL